MINLKNFFKKNEKGFGLVEALVALAVVGGGIIVITSLTFRSMRRAKKNENQDVAVQIGVEAMDFLKTPGILKATVVPSSQNSSNFYKINDNFVLENVISKGELQADENSCNQNTTYFIDYLASGGYTICQQVKVEPAGSDRYDVDVIIVWKTVDGYEKRVFEAYRVGEITL